MLGAQNAKIFSNRDKSRMSYFFFTRSQFYNSKHGGAKYDRVEIAGVSNHELNILV